MLNRGFDQAFRRLVGAFKRYQDVPRSTENVAEIGAARWRLEKARNSMAAHRAYISSQRPPAPILKIAISDDELARLKVNAISAGVG